MAFKNRFSTPFFPVSSWEDLKEFWADWRISLSDNLGYPKDFLN